MASCLLLRSSLLSSVLCNSLLRGFHCDLLRNRVSGQIGLLLKLSHPLLVCWVAHGR